MRWHRELVACKYDGTARRRPGRPRLSEDLRSLVVGMANDNETWGYPQCFQEVTAIPLRR